MTLHVGVYGLWHLGCTTAACLASHGFRVTGLDPDPSTVHGLRAGKAPLMEPGLDELIARGLASGRLSFTSDPQEVSSVDVLWVTFDTPVDDQDRPDADFVEKQLHALSGVIPHTATVLISSQVPVGFCSRIERLWSDRRGVRSVIAYSPENLRLGKAIDCFLHQERMIVGIRHGRDRERLEGLLSPFTGHIEWMSVESAEMTKHAMNAFLAMSVSFANEVARLCEKVGADATEVERGLKTDARIGPRAYLAPGAPFAGGTLGRDLSSLIHLGDVHGVDTPLCDSVFVSNTLHKEWLRDTVCSLAEKGGVVAVLGLTYKAGTSTLRRSLALELCSFLIARGFVVHAHDPTVSVLPPEGDPRIRLTPTAGEALRGADVALIATEWPEYRALRPDEVVAAMKTPRVVDPARFLSAAFAADSRIRYVSVGQPSPFPARPAGGVT